MASKLGRDLVRQLLETYRKLLASDAQSPRPFLFAYRGLLDYITDLERRSDAS